MRLTRINRISDHRLFRAFTWPADLPDFGRFNVIYGWNGTGKTTLSNLLRLLMTRERPTEGHVEFRIDQHAVSNVNLAAAPLPSVRVFNRQFIDASVFEVPRSQLAPIFFLGEDSVEKQKRIEDSKAELPRLHQLLLQRQSKNSTASNDYETFCTDHARVIREMLTAPGGAYNNYDKRNVKEAMRALTPDTSKAHVLEEAQKAALRKAKDGRALERVSRVTTEYPDVAAMTEAAQRLLARTVTSQIIEALAADAEVAQWVGSGLPLHSGNHASETCRFCGQVMPARRLHELEAHFNDEFTAFQNELTMMIGVVEQAQSAVRSIVVPEKGLLYEDLRLAFAQSASTLSLHRGNVLLYLDALKRALAAKKASPFKTLELLAFLAGASSGTAQPMSTLETIFSAIVGGAGALGALLGRDAVARMNELIDAHNARTENFTAEVEKARKALELAYVAEAFEKHQAKALSVTASLSDVREVEQLIARTKSSIAALEAEIRQHHRPADELTAEIQAYLGRDELALETSDTGYAITRYGEPALNLSEGERTAIAFLYFLKSLQDASFDLKNGIVVIDDPVSSLDANALFSAFGFMQHRTKDAGQLFILTHNFSFFRLVRNWFNNQPGQRKEDIAKRPSRFYMLASAWQDNRRIAALAPLDPLLHEFESEYHYLFKRVFEEATRMSAAVSLAEYYGLPNIARRLLEAFLAFRVPGRSNELYQQLELIDCDQGAKTRILRFLHTHSHHGRIADPEHDPSVLAETPAVLRDVLSLIEKVDPGHYAGMESLVRPQAPSAPTVLG